ncbi:MAG: hypothetical protein QOH42_2208, partial [Blastocatellia bacterium]|nr:hypothetical protein [Blastocatellia bacterium]
MVGDVPWGTHFCHFYETKQDLLDTLIPYFKAGLESREFCLWVVSDAELITLEDAKGALVQAIPDLDRQLTDENIEILSGHDWYFEQHALNLERAKHGWDAKLKRALARGYEGLRVSADTFWLAEKDWNDFFAYEKQVNDWITDQSMTVMCTYPLAKSGATEVLDVVQAHQFAIARRQGEWEVIETPELIQVKAEIKRLNEEMEQRVIGRTNELRGANEELRNEITERKRAEDALRRSEDHLRMVIGTIPTMAWSLRPDHVLDFVNQRWLDYTGLTFEEAIEAPTRTVHPEDLPRALEKWLVIKASSEAYEDEMRLQRADGEYRWFLIRIASLLDERGNLLKRYGIAIDIEDRKQAEDALRRSEDRIRLIIDTIPTMAWTLRPDGVVDFVNQRWLNYTGERGIEDTNRIVHPEDLPGVTEKWRADMAVEKPSESEMRIRRADGEYRWFLVRTAPLRDEQGNLLKWYGVSTDIEDLKRAEKALKESRRRLEEAQRIAHVGHWDRDLETRRITWSDEIYRILGVPLVERDSLRTEWLDVVHPEDRPRLAVAIEEMLGGIRRLDVEFRIVRPDEEVRFLHSQGDVIRDERGRPVRMFGTAQDITDRKLAEELLKATNEQLRSLSARLQSAREQEGIRIAR